MAEGPGSVEGSRPSRRWLPRAALLAVLVAAVYAESLGNGFIWDDEGYVQNNQTLRTARGLSDMWLVPGAVPQYYPLVHTTFWVEYRLFGLDPLPYHATNVLLHAFAAILLYRLLARLAVPGAWFAAALFAVHPVHVESVAWVTERKNVLSMVFGLASILLYLRASPPERSAGERPSPGAYAVSFLLYLAALFSKTVTVSVPAVLLVVYAWKRGRLSWRDPAWLAPFFAAGVALASVTVWLERTHVGAQGPEWSLTATERVLVAGRALWFYAGKLAWPHPLAFFYPRWTLDVSSPWQYLPVAGAVVAIGALFALRHRIGRGPLAAVLVFAGVLVPALGIFDVYPFRYSFVADHFQYHASAALLALAAAVTTLGTMRLPGRLRPLAGVAGAVVLLVLGFLAWQQTRAYRDLPTLYRSVIDANPTSWTAYNNLGRILLNGGRFEEALPLLREAVRLRPDDARIRNNLGSALSGLGRLEEAEAELRRALVSTGEPPDDAESRVYLAVVRIRQERYAEAAELLQEAASLRPGDPWTLHNWGVALAAHGDLEAGIARLADAIALDPTRVDSQREIGAMKLARGDLPGAIANFRQAVTLEPGNAGGWSSLGQALLASGDAAGAESALRRSLELDAADAETRHWLGVTLAARGNSTGAAEAFEAVLRIQPGDPRAVENLRRLRAGP